ncbi:MAG TPA: UDP-glucose 4-epimerase GalE [Acidobacteriota bacterium]
MRILVTGGAGYIGSHTVQLLRRAGHQPVIFDNFSTGRPELVQAEEVIQADLADRRALREAFGRQHFEAVLHFASLIQVGESFSDPQKYYQHNLVNSLNLLEAMLAAGVNKLIFSSSAAVYGLPRQIPITEDHPLEPANPYGQTKFFLEKIMQEYDRAYGLRSIALRYFNAAGADPEGRLGEMHEPETHLIPNILNFLLGRKGQLELFGTDFETPDGTAIRDYIHVTDLAEAHVLALERLAAGGRSEALNLGTNRPTSVMEIIKKAEEVTGRKVAFSARPRRRGDVPVLLASKEKAAAALGWKLRYSDLETILGTAWAWHRKIIS